MLSVGHLKRGIQGFTLLEVLVALLIVSIGLLGLAGLQVAAINNTNTSRVRGLAAIQAGSLAAAMHANPAYWQNITASTTVANIPASGSCASSACTASQVAGYDVATWTNDLASLAIPSASGGFQCTPANASGPVTCTITISWSEKTVNVNSLSSTASSAISTASYQMVVQP
ncbi:hypothetical protein VI26_09230 [Chromobacterium sp. LK1]|nr:hypothetical protein VI26_09230 [Chromobacterium sp. LK1]